MEIISQTVGTSMVMVGVAFNIGKIRGKNNMICKRCGASGVIVLSSGICEHCNDELCDELAGRNKEKMTT